MKRLRMEQINDLTEDELTMLWFTINVVNPNILRYEITPNLFTSLNFDMLKDRVLQCEQFVKEEFKSVFNDMKRKLGMPYTEIKPEEHVIKPEEPVIKPEEPVINTVVNSEEEKNKNL